MINTEARVAMWPRDRGVTAVLRVTTMRRSLWVALTYLSVPYCVIAQQLSSVPRQVSLQFGEHFLQSVLT